MRGAKQGGGSAADNSDLLKCFIIRNTVKRSGVNGGAKHKARRQCRRQFRPFEKLFVFVTQLNGREIMSNLIIPDYSDRYLIVLV